MYQNENDPNLNPEALKDLYCKSCYEILISDESGENKNIIYCPLGSLESFVKHILLYEGNEVTILSYGEKYEKH